MSGNNLANQPFTCKKEIIFKIHVKMQGHILHIQRTIITSVTIEQRCKNQILKESKKKPQRVQQSFTFILRKLLTAVDVFPLSSCNRRNWSRSLFVSGRPVGGFGQLPLPDAAKHFRSWEYTSSEINNRKKVNKYVFVNVMRTLPCKTIK